MIRVWFAVTAAVCVGFGLYALLAPHSMTSLYGGATNDHGALWARYYGSAIMFTGYVAWFARSVRSDEVLRFITLALAALFSLNLAVSLYAQVEELLNALHWTTIAGQAFLAGLWAYYRFAALRVARVPASAPGP
jgi:hypothetical protein